MGRRLMSMVGRCCFDMERAGRNLKVRKGGLPPLFLIENEQVNRERADIINRVVFQEAAGASHPS